MDGQATLRKKFAYQMFVVPGLLRERRPRCPNIHRVPIRASSQDGIVTLSGRTSFCCPYGFGAAFRNNNPPSHTV